MLNGTEQNVSGCNKVFTGEMHDSHSFDDTTQSLKITNTCRLNEHPNSNWIYEYSLQQKLSLFPFIRLFVLFPKIIAGKSNMLPTKRL